MSAVAKKKPDPVPPTIEDAEKSAPFLVRLHSVELQDALDEYAKSIRRSRNMAIILILEEKFTALGIYPRKKK